MTVEAWPDWVKTSKKLSSHTFSSLWTQQQSFNKTKKSNLYTYIQYIVNFFSPTNETLTVWMLHVNVHFWNKWCGKASLHSQLRDRGVNKQRKNKKSGAKQHWSLYVRHHWLPAPLAFAEQQNNRISCTLSLRLHLPPSQDRTWPAPALASLSQEDGDLWGCFVKQNKTKTNVGRVKANMKDHHENNVFVFRKGWVFCCEWLPLGWFSMI